MCVLVRAQNSVIVGKTKQTNGHRRWEKFVGENSTHTWPPAMCVSVWASLGPYHSTASQIICPDWRHRLTGKSCQRAFVVSSPFDQRFMRISLVGGAPYLAHPSNRLAIHTKDQPVTALLAALLLIRASYKGKAKLLFVCFSSQNVTNTVRAGIQAMKAKYCGSFHNGEF